jgi:hypothetical protein
VFLEEATFTCLWHEEVENAESHCRDCGKEQKSDVETVMMHDRTGDHLTESSTDADRGSDRAEGDIKSP